MSHSGPERYVIIAISKETSKETRSEDVQEQNNKNLGRVGKLTACKFEAHVWRRTIIVESLVWVGHQNYLFFGHVMIVVSSW